MPALSPAQVTDVNTAIDAVQTYIDTLQLALAAAANAGDTASAMTIESRYEDAQQLESQLKGLLTISVAAGLLASVQSINNTTSVLQQQKTQIDTVVQAVGVVAGVLGEIAAIAAAVVQLVATLP
jgi:hypothetical protein